jgi:hypothetical protein
MDITDVSAHYDLHGASHPFVVENVGLFKLHLDLLCAHLRIGGVDVLFVEYGGKNLLNTASMKLPMGDGLPSKEGLEHAMHKFCETDADDQFANLMSLAALPIGGITDEQLIAGDEHALGFMYNKIRPLVTRLTQRDIFRIVGWARLCYVRPQLVVGLGVSSKVLTGESFVQRQFPIALPIELRGRQSAVGLISLPDPDAWQVRRRNYEYTPMGLPVEDAYCVFGTGPTFGGDSLAEMDALTIQVYQKSFQALQQGRIDSGKFDTHYASTAYFRQQVDKWVGAFTDAVRKDEVSHVVRAEFNFRVPPLESLFSEGWQDWTVQDVGEESGDMPALTAFYWQKFGLLVQMAAGRDRIFREYTSEYQLQTLAVALNYWSSKALEVTGVNTTGPRQNALISQATMAAVLETSALQLKYLLSGRGADRPNSKLTLYGTQLLRRGRLDLIRADGCTLGFAMKHKPKFLQAMCRLFPEWADDIRVTLSLPWEVAQQHSYHLNPVRVPPEHVDPVLPRVNVDMFPFRRGALGSARVVRPDLDALRPEDALVVKACAVHVQQRLLIQLSTSRLDEWDTLVLRDDAIADASVKLAQLESELSNLLSVSTTESRGFDSSSGQRGDLLPAGGRRAMLMSRAAMLQAASVGVDGFQGAVKTTVHEHCLCLAASSSEGAGWWCNGATTKCHSSASGSRASTDQRWTCGVGCQFDLCDACVRVYRSRRVVGLSVAASHQHPLFETAEVATALCDTCQEQCQLRYACVQHDCVGFVLCEKCCVSAQAQRTSDSVSLLPPSTVNRCTGGVGRAVAVTVAAVAAPGRSDPASSTAVVAGNELIDPPWGAAQPRNPRGQFAAAKLRIASVPVVLPRPRTWQDDKVAKTGGSVTVDGMSDEDIDVDRGPPAPLVHNAMESAAAAGTRSLDGASNDVFDGEGKWIRAQARSASSQGVSDRRHAESTGRRRVSHWVQEDPLSFDPTQHSIKEIREWLYGQKVQQAKAFTRQFKKPDWVRMVHDTQENIRKRATAAHASETSVAAASLHAHVGTFEDGDAPASSVSASHGGDGVAGSGNDSDGPDGSGGGHADLDLPDWPIDIDDVELNDDGDGDDEDEDEDDGGGDAPAFSVQWRGLRAAASSSPSVSSSKGVSSAIAVVVPSPVVAVPRSVASVGDAVDVRDGNGDGHGCAPAPAVNAFGDGVRCLSA